MDFDTIRPIISGLIGAVIAGWLSVKWAKRLPYAKSSKKQREVFDKQRQVIKFANAGAWLGIATGFILYLGGLLDRYDWRGLGISLGLTALLPLTVMVVGNLRGGSQAIKSGLQAYAIAQKTPARLLFSLMVLMVAGGVWAAIAFMPRDSQAEQAGAGQPATRPVVEPEGGDEPQSEAEGRSR